MYEKELQRILNASQNNALTFFVGAGVSALSGAPTWKALIHAISDKLGQTRKDEYSSDENLQIPQMFYYSLGENKEEYYRFVKEQLYSASLLPNTIHREMLNLNPVSFITTNYDTLLEDAAVQYCQSFKVVSQDEDVPTIFGDRFILKLHGDFKHNNLSQMYYQITQHYCGYVSKNQQKKLITWANKLIQMNFSFDLFKMLVQCDARISKAAKTQLKVYLKQRIDAAKNKNNNGVVVYPTKQPYEELDQVGYWCLLNVLKAKDFQEFLGNSEAFDFYCEYTKFDFNKFDVSWLLNLYPHTLEQIAKNEKVKGCVRVAIADALNDGEIALSDSQRLQSILVKHFC